MAKFRKKPVIIDAVQLTWPNWNEICDFVTKEYFGCGVWVHPTDNSIYDDTPLKQSPVTDQRIGLIIKTLEGDLLAVQNDWIIRGVNGEFYPCKPDIFEKTYDPIINP